jgi:hypothetical protein
MNDEEARAKGCLGNCQKCERPLNRPGVYQPGDVLRWIAPACSGHGTLVRVIRPNLGCIYSGDHYDGETIEDKPHFFDVKVEIDGSTPFERVKSTKQDTLERFA